MKFFEKSKPASVIQTQEVSLEKFPESSLLRVMAQLLPQSSTLSQLRPAYDPIMDACRAELSRRWQKRGAPISISLPAKLPAVAILASVGAAKIAERILGDEEATWRTGGPSLAGMVEELSGAREIISAVVRVLEDSKVDVSELPAAQEGAAT